jgi:hypothetical protein
VTPAKYLQIYVFGAFRTTVQVALSNQLKPLQAEGCSLIKVPFRGACLKIQINNSEAALIPAALVI